MPHHDPGPAFRALHKPGDPFTLANAWDAGSAKMLHAMGAQALATTSAGHAFTLGRPDMGGVTNDIDIGQIDTDPRLVCGIEHGGKGKRLRSEATR